MPKENNLKENNQASLLCDIMDLWISILLTCLRHVISLKSVNNMGTGLNNNFYSLVAFNPLSLAAQFSFFASFNHGGRGYRVVGGRGMTGLCPCSE